MSATSIAQTVVYQTIGFIDTETAILQPLVITINFSGPVPQHLIPTPNNIPIKVSISLSEDCCMILAPFVCSPMANAPTTNLPIPFLPLPPTFDPTNTHHWAMLTKETKHWLVNEVHAPHPQWTWGHEAF
ncbi:hypothetical protein PAXRUDRAFT_37013 [Paxillus rubicundulus Ve08.2h10]|uniref:Uncharacterized protein n=1 Tax=Paxillus rubicundulus Ve08.2h10 TaxID=930991 RepID=A0A0D0BU70_9AGAM|nr:hypothetical protein PAXRUDRAFT_37013 [Paxillus rubicundulus Ve08.2h10]